MADKEYIEYMYEIVTHSMGLPTFEQYKKVCKQQCTQYKKECNPKKHGDINRITCPLVYAGSLPRRK